MPTCVVNGCTSGYTSNTEKFIFFTIPKNPVLAASWKAAIKRTDINVKSGRAVCEKHFRHQDILWQRQLLGPDGSVVGVTQLKIPRLREGSIPTIFPWTELDESPSVEHHHELEDIMQDKQPRESHLHPTFDLRHKDMTTPGKDELGTDPCNSLSDAKRRKLSLYNEENDISFSHLVTDSRDESLSAGAIVKIKNTVAAKNFIVENSTGPKPLVTFHELLSAEISLPPGWILDKNCAIKDKLIIVFTNKILKVNETFMPFILKALVVKDDLSVEISVLGRSVNLEESGVLSSIKYIKQLEDLLITVNNLNVCSGCTGPSVETEMSQLKCNTLKKDCTGVWRHESCRLLLQKVSICKFCQSAKKSLVAKLRRWKSRQVTKTATTCPKQKKSWLQLQSKYRCAIRDKKLAQNKIKKMKSELRLCREKMAHLSSFNFEEQISNGNISENEAHVVKQILDAAKHKNSKGRNYSEPWMLLCLLLHLRSPSGYDFLRRNEILPLPCVRTIRRYLSKMETGCGFDDQFFKVLKLALKKKTEKQRHGILLFDEMSTRESVSVDSKNLTYKGLVDFGKEGPRSSDFSEKANHGLVLMFQPLDDTYTQPIAVFASRGPVKGTILAQLIIKAIVLLEDAGAKIHAVISDGASTNRKFWSEVGVCGMKRNFRNYFDHPTVEGRKVFVFSDSPHLIKTIRNRFHNNRILHRKKSRDATGLCGVSNRSHQKGTAAQPILGALLAQNTLHQPPGTLPPRSAPFRGRSIPQVRQ